MKPAIVLAAVAVVASCGKKPQSPKDGVEVLCQTASRMPGYDRISPALRGAAISAYWAKAISHENIVVLVNAIFDEPGRAGELLAREAKAVGLDSCPFAAELSVLLPPPLVEVGGEMPALDGERALVTITKTTIGVDGRTVELASVSKAVAATRRHTAIVHVAADVPYGRLMTILKALTVGGIERMGIAVKGDKGPASIPIALPKTTAGPLEKLPAERELGIVVSTRRDKLIVWSLTGLAGTLADPLLTAEIADIDKLQTTLRLLVDARWKGKSRPAATRAIIFQSTEPVAFDKVAPLLAAIHGDASGELFPEIRLGLPLSNLDALAPPPSNDDAPEPVRVSISVKAAGSLAPLPIERRIRSRYLAGIKRCARSYTGQAQPSATLRLDTSGRISRASVADADDEVARCLEAMMLEWRFGRPPAAADFTIIMKLKR